MNASYSPQDETCLRATRADFRLLGEGLFMVKATACASAQQAGVAVEDFARGALLQFMLFAAKEARTVALLSGKVFSLEEFLALAKDCAYHADKQDEPPATITTCMECGRHASECVCTCGR